MGDDKVYKAVKNIFENIEDTLKAHRLLICSTNSKIANNEFG